MAEIKKGDLVMVVRGTSCCGAGKGVGFLFTVHGVRVRPPMPCPKCGTKHPATQMATHSAGVVGFSFARRKKIDPPATGEYDRVPVRESTPA